jgi:hypothetical protein
MFSIGLRLPGLSLFVNNILCGIYFIFSLFYNKSDLVDEGFCFNFNIQSKF